MNEVPFVVPKHLLEAFNCPHCKAFAAQHWIRPWDYIRGDSSFRSGTQPCYFSRCSHCKEICVWWDEKMLVPDTSVASMPHKDMPEQLLADFEEARAILGKSPRSSAALLRLCIQKLCKALGEPGKDINADIASLVQKGLPVQIQRSLDIVRVVGNEQVHPGTLDVRDDPSIALELFGLINFIVEDRIARPKAINSLYLRLPEPKRKAIEQRDATAKG